MLDTSGAAHDAGHQAVEVATLQPDVDPAADPAAAADAPLWYLIHLYAPQVSTIRLVAPGQPAVPAMVRGRWAVVRSSVAPDGTAPESLQLLDSAGQLRWTYDIDHGQTTPCSLVLASGVPYPCQADPADTAAVDDTAPTPAP